MNQLQFTPPVDDIIEVLENCQDALRRIKPGRILVTGGNGFIGTWIIRVLLMARIELSIELNIEVVSKNTLITKANFSKEEVEQIKFHEFDLASGIARDYFERNQYSLVIHAAVSSLANQIGGSNFNPKNDLQMLRNILESSRINSDTKIMYLSSGAVYRINSGESKNETVTKGDLNVDLSDYGESKSRNEREIKFYQSSKGFQTLIPRIFTVYGPGFSIHKNFAITQFIHNSLQGKEIIIYGNKNSLRSYLYISDLIEVLIRLVVTDHSIREVTLDVGGSESLSIGDLAFHITKVFGQVPISNESLDKGPDIYLPNNDIKKVIPEFEQRISLNSGLNKWKKFLKESDY